MEDVLTGFSENSQALLDESAEAYQRYKE